MNYISKIGLSLLLFGFYGAYSYGLSPVSPQPGACSFQPHPTQGETVCKKGKKKVTYKIEKQHLNMTYPVYEARTNQHANPVSGGGDSISGPIGIGPEYCYQEGFTVDFCSLYKYKGTQPLQSNHPIGPKKLLVSHYDKWDRTVCYSSSGQTQTNVGMVKATKCKQALTAEVAKKKKRGWKCKYRDYMLPPGVDDAPSAPSGQR